MINQIIHLKKTATVTLDQHPDFTSVALSDSARSLDDRQVFLQPTVALFVDGKNYEIARQFALKVLEAVERHEQDPADPPGSDATTPEGDRAAVPG
jgi:hypothetical protein